MLIASQNLFLSSTRPRIVLNCTYSINEYEGRDIPCGADDASVTTGGLSGQCPLPGEEVITSLGITGINENFWFNVGMVILLQFIYRIGAYVLLRRAR